MFLPICPDTLNLRLRNERRVQGAELPRSSLNYSDFHSLKALYCNPVALPTIWLGAWTTENFSVQHARSLGAFSDLLSLNALLQLATNNDSASATRNPPYPSRS